MLNVINCDKIVAIPMKNSQQLLLAANCTPCDSIIDPDNFFYNHINTGGSSYERVRVTFRNSASRACVVVLFTQDGLIHSQCK